MVIRVGEGQVLTTGNTEDSRRAERRRFSAYHRGHRGITEVTEDICTLSRSGSQDAIRQSFSQTAQKGKGISQLSLSPNVKVAVR